MDLGWTQLLYKSKKGEGLPWLSSGLRLRNSTAGGMGLIPGHGTKISQAGGHSQKKGGGEIKMQLLIKSLNVQWCIII